MTSPWRLAVAPALLLALACSSPKDSGQGAGTAAPAAGDTVRVVFTLPGDDIGNPETAAVLEKIKALIAARGTGEVLRTGYGMGKMELIVKLRGPGGVPALEDTIRAAHPGARYRVGRESGPQT